MRSKQQKSLIFGPNLGIWGYEMGPYKVKLKVEDKKWSQNFDWQPSYRVIDQSMIL